MQVKLDDKVLQLNDKTFEIFIQKEKIQQEISALAARLEQDYAGKEVVFIAVLNGAFMFAADLMKSFSLPCEITFVKMSSYQGMHSSGRVDEVIGLTTSVKDKHVVILEDIVDTGITMEKLFTLLSVEKPASLEIATLLFKPEAFKGTHTPTYIGFSIPNKFVVGYGLDYDELGRNTEHIYQLKGEESH
ncbi:MAG: hypoxanthine phosphoribosyltransferase [Fluviicola sp.]